MLRADVMSRILPVAAAIVLSASAAYAGGAGGIGVEGALTPFKCYFILHGDSPGQVIDLVDQFNRLDANGDAIPDRVRVGTARLLCTPVSGTVVTGDLNPDPDNALLAADHLTCYDMHRRGFDDPRANVSLENKLTPQGSPDRASVRFAALLCMPTNKEVIVP